MFPKHTNDALSLVMVIHKPCGFLSCFQTTPHLPPASAHFTFNAPTSNHPHLISSSSSRPSSIPPIYTPTSHNTMSAPVTFSYFPLTARGLSTLLTMEEYNVKYTGNKVQMENWPEMKASGVCPFGQLPLLETEDAGVVTQSVAVLKYLGRRVNAVGATVAEKARSDMLVGIAEDFLTDLLKTQPSILNKDKPADAVATMWGETFPARLALVERFLGAGKDRFTESGRCIGELHLFSILNQMKAVSPTCLDATPALSAFYERVLALPSVQTVLDGKSAFGEVIHFLVKQE